jgi:hypothetical protein
MHDQNVVLPNNRLHPMKQQTGEAGATRCRIVECTQVVIWSTRHVPAGPYAGVLPLR